MKNFKNLTYYELIQAAEMNYMEKLNFYEDKRKQIPNNFIIEYRYNKTKNGL